MWAPADLFKPGLNAATFACKRAVTYFYERPVLLLAAVICVAALIWLASAVSDRIGRRA